MSTMVSQMTGVSIVYLTVCSSADRGKHQSSASLAFVQGINSPHKGPVTRKMFPFDDAIMVNWCLPLNLRLHCWIRSVSSTAKHVLAPVDMAVVMSISMSGKVMSTGEVQKLIWWIDLYFQKYVDIYCKLVIVQEKIFQIERKEYEHYLQRGQDSNPGRDLRNQPPADAMIVHKPTELSRIKLQNLN